MINFWILFFVLGSLIGRCHGVRVNNPWLDSEWLSSTIALASLSLFGPFSIKTNRYIKLIFVAILAIIWGAKHNAPPADQGLLDTYAVAEPSAWDNLSKGPLLIKSDNATYLAYGQRTPFAVGKLNVISSPTLFARYRAIFHAEISQAPVSGWFDHLAFKFRDNFNQRLERLPVQHRRWLQATILGDLSKLPTNIQIAVKETGLHHLLVISGLHLVIVTRITDFLLRLIPQLAYATRAISANTWIYCSASIRILVATTGIIYFIAVGGPPNAQRAILLSSLWQYSTVFSGIIPALLRLRLLLLFHTIAFPIGFLSETTFLGWGAYAIILDISNFQGWRHLRTLSGMFKMQSRMLILAAGIFGEFNTIPALLMPCLIPIFTLILGISVILICTSTSATLQTFMMALHSALKWFLLKSADLVDVAPWLSLKHDFLPEWFQPAALILTTVMMLNICQRMKIAQFVRR
jgi:hypothetical protein